MSQSSAKYRHHHTITFVTGSGAAFRVPPESDGRAEEEKTKDRDLRLRRICSAFTLQKEACCVKGFPANPQLSGWDLPGGPARKPLCDHRRGPEYHLGLGNKDRACQAVRPKKIQAKRRQIFGQTQKQTVSSDFYSSASVNAIDCEGEDK